MVSPDPRRCPVQNESPCQWPSRLRAEELLWGLAAPAGHVLCLCGRDVATQPVCAEGALQAGFLVGSPPPPMSGCSSSEPAQERFLQHLAFGAAGVGNTFLAIRKEFGGLPGGRCSLCPELPADGLGSPAVLRETWARCQAPTFQQQCADCVQQCADCVHAAGKTGPFRPVMPFIHCV